MKNIIGWTSLNSRRNALKRKVVRRRIWKGLNIVVAVTTLLNVSAVGSFLAPQPVLAASIGSYDQCANDDGDGYATGDTGCRWINGNLQANNSTYYEGDSTVQRVWLDGLDPGSSHSVTLQYGTTKQGKHAYDFLTTYNASENWITEADLCQDIDGCATSYASESTWAIPSDPNGSGEFESGTRNFVMRGGTLTGATSPILSGSYANDSETSITVSFNVASSGDMCVTDKKDVTTCGVALFFGAHVGETANWQPFNGTTGATSIPGSPYHVALDAIDGDSSGRRDNQMQAGAILVPALGALTVYKAIDTDGDGGYDQGNNYANNLNWAWNVLTNGSPSEWNPFGSTTNLLEGTYPVTENGQVGLDGYHYVGWNYGDMDCSEEYNFGSPEVDVVEGEETFITLCNQRDTGTIHVFKKVRTSNGFWWEPQLDEQWSWNLSGDATDYHWGDSVDVPTNVTQTITEDPNDFSAPDYATEWSCYQGENPFSSGTGRRIDLTLTEDGQEIVCTFYNRELGDIHGQKWNDQNGNGNWDNGEPALNGWTIFIDENDNGVLDESEKSMVTQFHDDSQAFTTDDNGWYWFENLPDGDYKICEVGQSGWLQTYPQNGNHNCHIVAVGQSQIDRQDPSTCSSQETANAVVAPSCNFGNKQNEVVIQSVPNLSITKVNSVVTFANPGTTVTYTVVVKNTGNGIATSVDLTDVLPTGFTFTGGASTKTFNLGDIAPGDSVTTTYVVGISPSQAAGVYTNTATADGTNTSPVSASSNVEVRVPTVLAAVSPELDITKTVNVDVANPGSVITYTVTITNSGDGAATNVVVTDELPVGFTYVDGGGSTKTWTFATLAAGGKEVMTYDVTVGDEVGAGVHMNRAFVLADGIDPITAQAAVEVRIPQVLGLATTGVSARDYAAFSLGICLMALGFIGLRKLRLDPEGEPIKE